MLHAGASEPHEVDQRTGGGDWYPLGTYTFAADGAEGVFIDNTDTDGHVIVDVAKFTPAP